MTRGTVTRAEARCDRGASSVRSAIHPEARGEGASPRRGGTGPACGLRATSVMDGLAGLVLGLISVGVAWLLAKALRE